VTGLVPGPPRFLFQLFVIPALWWIYFDRAAEAGRRQWRFKYSQPPPPRFQNILWREQQPGEHPMTSLGESSGHHIVRRIILQICDDAYSIY
jgi:hypothetical protein